MRDETVPQTSLVARTIEILSNNVRILLPGLFLFVALTGFNVWRSTSAQKTATAIGLNDTSAAHSAIEERFGVRFTGVYLIGKQGLVDLRYRVVDAGKAKNFGHYTETSPMLIAEDSGLAVEVTIMGLHNHRVEAGRTYYILYRNTANALEPGSFLTIQLDDMKIEHVEVQ